jgi:hypothetical protein
MTYPKYIVRPGGFDHDLYLQRDGTTGPYKTAKRFSGPSAQARAEKWAFRMTRSVDFGLFKIDPRRAPTPKVLTEEEIDKWVEALMQGHGVKYQGHNSLISIRPICKRQFPMLLEFCRGAKMYGSWEWVSESKLRQLFRDCPPIRKLPQSRRIKIADKFGCA